MLRAGRSGRTGATCFPLRGTRGRFRSATDGTEPVPRSPRTPLLPMPAPRHLLTVWNPSYSESAMDAHLEVLLGWAARHEAGEVQADDVYVWWAKLKSENRQQPLPHTAEVLALQEQIDAGHETHLYLTDYRSLYMGHVAEITAEALLVVHPEQADHMPQYYRDRAADFWFLLTDVRLLVADDTRQTIEELKRLRNLRYNDRPVSLYGGMVELPLVVRRDDDISWFSDRALLTEGRLWAQFDAEQRGDAERMGQELRDNLLGEEVWRALEPGSRVFLASAEAIFRSRRGDPRFDFSGPALSDVKAIELELNRLLFPLLPRQLGRAAPAKREVFVEGRRLDLGGSVPHQSLGVIRTLLEREPTVRQALRLLLPAADLTWLTGQLPLQLAGLTEIRNRAAHAEPVSRAAATSIRAEVLGVGGEGLSVQIARVKGRVG
jgi:hypothetical protein